MLEITNLSVSFGGLTALDNLSLTVDEGEIVSVIGPNGAGKTTFFNLISGLIAPDGGEMTFNGDSLVGLDPHEVTKAGIARTFQNVRLFPNMTVAENVAVAQHCRTTSRLFATLAQTRKFRDEEREVRRRAEEILGFFGTRLVGYRLDQPASSLSYANRRRLEIARALGTSPQLLLLDEPTAGMNPSETAELTGKIGELRDAHEVTIVLIEHDMGVVEGVSDRVVVLDHGEAIAEGLYEEVSTDPYVIEAYLGRPAEGDKTDTRPAEGDKTDTPAVEDGGGET